METINFKTESLPANLSLTPEILNYRENEVVLSEGQALRGLYLVRSGVVKVVVRRELTRGRIQNPEYITKLVGPGEFFAISSLVQGSTSQYSVKALAPTEVHIFPKEVISSVISGPNLLLRNLFQQMVKSLEESERIDQLHYLASVQERIAYQLVLLAEKFGKQTPRGLSVGLRLTRNELAQLAGTINESLSRHLTELKNQGLVELVGKEIVVKDLQALKEKSGNYRQN